MQHLYVRVVILCLFILSGHWTHAQIFVDVDAPASGDGTSWATAYRSLQTALGSASNGDQIWVAEGTYYPTDGSDETLAFTLIEGVEIYGGFLGTESLLSRRNYATNLTILSGDIGATGVDTDNSQTIVYIGTLSAATLLDGFIIEDGYADGATDIGRSGPGIYINSLGSGNTARPRISNCTFRDNYAANSGGAVYIDASFSGIAVPTFTNCAFEDNHSNGPGGAVYDNGIIGGNCSPVFRNCSFTNNYAVDSGGAFFNHGGTGNANPKFYNCDFDSNTAENNGGAMYNLGSGDLTTNPPTPGFCNPTIINCRFYKNAGNAAGALYNNGGTGGNSNATITNCTFVGNEALNTAGGTGGAIYSNGDNSGNSSSTITNCIIWGNIGPFGSHVLRNVNGSPTINYCIVDVATCADLNNGTGANVTCGANMFYNVDPGFTDQANGNLRPILGSNAIDVGHSPSNGESEDLDGYIRISDGVIDLGAYERRVGALPIELVDFQAFPKNRAVVLQWATANEVNNEYFAIEHSTDGRTFTTIEKMLGAGNSVTQKNYLTIDPNPSRGANYYRLRQIDYDGTSTLSEIRVVNFNEAGTVAIYPNPVKDRLFITLSDFEATEVQYELFNLQGQVLQAGVLSTDQGQSELSAINHLSVGTYFVRIRTSNGETISQKFQKAN